jgi:catechol 2,3-dioxygenase
MTSIRKIEQPARRPGELGVHSVDHFTLMVPDVAQAERFYSCFGLDVREENGVLNLYTAGNSHRWGSIVEGRASA